MAKKNDYSINTVINTIAGNIKSAASIISNEVKQLIEAGYGKYAGNDNYGKPKSNFLQKLVDSTDEQLNDECERYIWLSAYAANNCRSDYHFMCDACYDECKRRGKPEIYTKAHKYVSAQ